MPSHRADTPAHRGQRSARRVSAATSAAASGTRRGQRAVRRPPRTSLSAPQVGIAGALGVATIAAPLSGVLAAPAPKAMLDPTATFSLAAAPAFPAKSAAEAEVPGVSSLRVIALDPTSSAAVPSLLSAPSVLLVTRASRSDERAVLPGCDGVVTQLSASNGALPGSMLCTLWDPQYRLRADAAVALAKLNILYQQHFGHDICLTDAYRSLSEQRRLKAIKPGLAASPGTSEHGWGLAVDMCDQVDNAGSRQYQWLRVNAPAYGWDNPDWARVGGSGPTEPWHWEYVAGE